MIQVKVCCIAVYMFKNMRIAILLDMVLNPSFKMTRSVANVAEATANKSKFI